LQCAVCVQAGRCAAVCGAGAMGVLLAARTRGQSAACVVNPESRLFTMARGNWWQREAVAE